MGQELMLYCGKCDRGLLASECKDDLCKICKGKTILWMPGDSASIAKQRWLSLYGR